MFFGEYQYSIDQKGRVTIPPKYRDSFKEGVILSRGLDICIAVYTVHEWEKKAAEISSLSMNQTKNRRLARATFSSAFTIDIDSQGRVLLPSTLKDYASISNEVVIVGIGACLEIWSKEQWTIEQDLIDEQAQHIAESIEDRK